VKEQIELLVRLQETDQGLDRLKGQIREGPERLRGLEKELQALEEDVEADKKRIQDLKKTQRGSHQEKPRAAYEHQEQQGVSGPAKGN
jgi:predicted  nucleic acid-binding Zn-ribbon protein